MTTTRHRLSARSSKRVLPLWLALAAVLATCTAAPLWAQEGSPLEGLQDRMSSDPEAMNTISDLKDSPDVKAVLDDPALMDALQRGDLSVLLANPKIARLAADPKVQELTNKYGR